MFTTPRSSRRLILTATAIASLLLGAGSAAALTPPASPLSRIEATAPVSEDLGEGWTLKYAETGPTLSYQSPVAVPLTDAGVRVKAGDRDLGPATVSGRTVSVPLTGPAPAASDLTIMVGRHELADLAERVDRGAAPRAVKLPSGASLARELDAIAPYGPAAEPLATTTFDYDLGDLPIEGFWAPADIVGHVIAPSDLSVKRPVVLFLHGRHGVCYGTTDDPRPWPCPVGTKPIPSMLGYTYLQTMLAQRGFVTVSIDANAINAQDAELRDGGALARAALVREHLRRVSGSGSPWAGKVSADFSKVVLVGHSRGGEGVNQASVLSSSSDPYRIAGVVHIAPTNFSRFSDPLIPSLTLLPNCDGDVSDLQGQQYVDHALDSGRDIALHSSLYVQGAGHNSFNTEWTPGLSVGGAWDDNVCSSATKLTHGEHRRVAASYVWAAAMAFTTPGSTTLTKMLDGRIQQPTALTGIHTRVTPVGGPREIVWRGKKPGAMLTAGSYCRGAGDGYPYCGGAALGMPQPHWPVADQRIPLAVALRTSTSAPVAGFRFATPKDLSARPWLEARANVETGVLAPSFRLTDAAGRTVIVAAQQTALTPRRVVTGSASPVRLLAHLVRAPLPKDGSVDLRAITSIEMLSARPVTGQLIDLSLASWGLGPDRRADLPVLTISPVATLMEGGDTGLRVELSRPAPRPVRIALAEEKLSWSETRPPAVRYVAIPAGVTSWTLPVEVVDNEAWDGRRARRVLIESRDRVTTAASASEISITDDEAQPGLSVTQSWKSVREGTALTWEISYTAPVSPDAAEVWAQVIPTTSRPLQVGDLTAAGRESWTMGYADLNAPLAEGAWWSKWTKGEQGFTLTMPTRRDGITEPWEFVKIRVTLEGGKPIYVGGSVRD